jgi:type I restriction enzyme S subunit
MSEGKTLGNQLQILSGFPFPSTNFTSERGGDPVIRIRDLQQQNPETYFCGNYDSSFLVSKGDILVGMDGDFNAVKWLGPRALLNQRVCKISTRDPAVLDQEFLYHSLQPQLDRIHKGTAQTTVKHLSTKDIYGIDTELPPLPEQKKIAEILSGIENTIQCLQEAIGSHERARNVLLESIYQDGYRKAKSGSDEWRILTIEELLANTPAPMRSGPFGSALLKEELAKEGIPFLGIDNVRTEEFIPCFKRFLNEVKFNELRRYVVYPHDVMITIMGTVGRACVVPEGTGPCVSSKHTWTMTFNRKKGKRSRGITS